MSRVSKHTLYSVGRFPNSVDMASRLETALGWLPVYWITQPELSSQVTQRFPNIACHDFTSGNRGEDDPVEAAELPPASPDALLCDGLLFRQGLSIVARHVLGSAMSVDQQINFLLERFNYAYRVVKAYDIQMLVFNATPHSVLDFCFYAAGRILDREVRILHLTGFRGLQVLLDGAESRPFGLNKLQAISSDDLSPEGSIEWDRLSDSSQDRVPWYVTLQNDRDNVYKRLYEAANALLDKDVVDVGEVSFSSPPLMPLSQSETADKALLTGWLRRLRLSRSVPNSVAEQQDGVDLFRRKFQEKHSEKLRRSFAFRTNGFRGPNVDWRQYYTYRDWALIAKQRWKRVYEEKTQDFDVERIGDQPFAFFAMHYQPERTTTPEGGLFADQLMTVRLIADCLPEGWRLMVKEHPSQFKWQAEGELGRWDGFHEELSEIKNVTLVPLDISSERIVREASSVVTINGTVGFEAAMRGCPVITLANPWYASEGVTLSARDHVGMREAFASIESGWRPDSSLVRAHLAKIEKLGRRAYLNPSHAPLYEGLDENLNIENLIDLFVSVEAIVSGDPR